jgi:poly(glycerol-phosphate) alpha-glucosyltransferase
VKILHSCQSLSRSFGGVFEAVRQLVAAQAVLQPGWSFRVIGADDENRTADAASWQGCETYAYQVRGLRSIGWSCGIRRQYEQFQPDVVHVHGLWMYYGMINGRICRRSGTPYVVSPHGMLDPWALSNSAWKKKLVRSLTEDRHLARATCLHALCNEEAAGIRALGFRNPICVIPNGVQLPLQGPQLPAPWSSEFAKDSRIMLYLGRLHPKKGLENLLKSWKELFLQKTLHSSPWKLVVAGWGDPGYDHLLREMASHYDLNQRVLFVGPLFGDAKTAAYQNAEAFVLPSFSEGLPMAVLEAWSHRLPVLMTPQCNLTVGFSRQAAIEIGTSVEAVLGPAQEFLVLPASEQKMIGENGYRLVCDQFTWTQVSSNLAHVYRWMRGEEECPTFGK